MGNSILGKGRKTNNSSYTPPDWALPLFRKSANDLMQLYNSTKGGNIYQGKRVADLSDATKNSISGLLNTANGFNNDYLNSLINQRSSSENNLNDMAAGKLIGHNQAFKKTLDNSLDDAANTINRQMSGAGRYGSGTNMGVLATKLGNIAQAANTQQYNQDVNNMVRANSQIDAARMGQMSNWTNRLNGEANAYSRALGGGQILDKNQQDKLNADKQKWEESDNQAWNRLKMFQQLLGGISKRYGNSNRTIQSNGFSEFSGLLGKLISKG